MVRLAPMEETEYRPYIERLIRTYAADHVRAGRWTPAEGEGEARKEVERLLPQGLATPNQFLFSILAGEPESVVGRAWLAVEPRGGFVYDLEVDPPHRRRGYAEAAMRALEPIARARGADRLGLHVFGDNVGARGLYRKLGYSETHVIMSKPLPE